MIVVMSDATDLVDLVIEVFDPRKRRTVLGEFDGGRQGSQSAASCLLPASTASTNRPGQSVDEPVGVIGVVRRLVVESLSKKLTRNPAFAVHNE
jgi:hypothetical protein